MLLAIFHGKRRREGKFWNPGRLPCNSVYFAVMKKPSSSDWYFSIDTGGTFTDCIATDPQGHVHRRKVLSSGVLRGTVASSRGPSLQTSAPWAQGNDLFRGYELRLPDQDFSAQITSQQAGWLELDQPLPMETGNTLEISAGEEAPLLALRLITETPLDQPFPPLRMRLGTTRGTNALLEHKGDPPLLVITEGWRDLPRIRDQSRKDLFALKVERPEPYHGPVWELPERIDARGKVEKAPTTENLQQLKAYCQEEQIDNAVVALTNSFRNASHEQAVKQVLQEAGLSYITTSQELSNEIHFLRRCETAIANAYLRPVLDRYLAPIRARVDQLSIMTSAGSLVRQEHFQPKDALLSGPAGGVVAAEKLARQTKEKDIITFDMGGTSSDVARYSGRFDYQYETEIGDARVSGPALHIHTVAAGGGSICDFDGRKYTVGPESGGAQPGPACYGAGGPLCLTDVNLLLGHLATDKIGIPLAEQAAEKALGQLLTKDPQAPDQASVLQGFLDIANEKMAEAIRQISTSQGYDPGEHALLAFGGAGGMHACAVAELLEMERLLLPRDGGILSATGMAAAREERFASGEWLQPLKEVQNLPGQIEKLQGKARQGLMEAGYAEAEVVIRHVFCYLRFQGQEHSLELEWEPGGDLAQAFEQAYRRLYGHFPQNRALELVRIKAIASERSPEIESAQIPTSPGQAPILRQQNCFTGQAWEEVPLYDFEALQPGMELRGPALLLYPTSTAYLAPGWEAHLDSSHTLRASHWARQEQPRQRPEAVELELFSNRFTGIAQEMGALLQRTAFSVNVKERLDFSCALLDARGDLIVNAPHIPVHLGALGVCTKAVVAELNLQEGDVAITNHPAYGGSHLPDVTLIAPIHYRGVLVGYAANRAHHAEIGGISPGSMPAQAKNLAQEGVVIAPRKLVKQGEVQWEALRQWLTEAPYPTRALEENLADLNAALAALESGKRDLQALLETHGRKAVLHHMEALQDYAHQSLWKALKKWPTRRYEAEEFLDDGAALKVSIDLQPDFLEVDFTGTAPTHSGNLNANPAIGTSVVLYVLRLIAGKNLPLNEGMLRGVKLIWPPGSLLHPRFPSDPRKCPAVVGGNVEVSQRLTDTLLKALELAACSQGTMNNVLFGNERFGFYETLCGGTGAGEGFAGTSAVHQHMTNTRITDPEIMEWRYPVVVEHFGLRRGSGGTGRWPGGDGAVRRLRFTEAVELTLLTQHRHTAPYGLRGGGPGAKGKDKVFMAAHADAAHDDGTTRKGAHDAAAYDDGTTRKGAHDAAAYDDDTTRKGAMHCAFTTGAETLSLQPGDRLTVETPGGGGWGEA